MYLTRHLPQYIALSLFFGGTWIQAFQANLPTYQWAHEQSNLKPHPAISFGKLPNGLHYLVLPHSFPPKNASIYLYVRAGSLMEQEHQRGLAHFLEHISFEDSESFSKQGLIGKWQEHGIAYGNQLNAHTSFTQTVYKIDIPQISPNLLDLGIKTLRSFSKINLATQAIIDKERGRVLAEKSEGETIQRRIQEQEFSFLFPESILPHRFPIGIDSVIKTATNQQLFDFKKSFYRPERMIVMVVGDIDPSKVIEKIQYYFNDLPQNPAPSPTINLGKIALHKDFQVESFSHPEITETTFSLYSAKKADFLTDTKESRRQQIQLSIANWILTNRLKKQSKKSNSPIQSGSAYHYSWLKEIDNIGVEVTAAPNEWREAVSLMEQELRRILIYGFSQDEYKEAIISLRKGLRKRAELQNNEPSSTITRNLVYAISNNRVLTSHKQNLAFFDAQIAKTSKTDCHLALLKRWETRHFALTTISKSEDNITRSDLVRTYVKSRKNKPLPPEKVVKKNFAYENWGKKGSIEEQKYFPSLDIYQLKLSNGVSVNFKSTNFKEKTVQIKFRIAGGLQSLPQNKPGLDSITSETFILGGLKKHDITEIQDIFLENQIDISFQITEDAFIIKATTSPDDLLLQLKLILAYLTDTGFRPEAFQKFHQNLKAKEKSLLHSIKGPQQQIHHYLHGSDNRFLKFPSVKILASYHAEEVSAWIRPFLDTSPLEINIIGDLSLKQALASLLPTLGALPARSSLKLTPTIALKLHSSPQKNDYWYQSTLPKSLIQLSWKTQGIKEDIKRLRRLHVLASIIQLRLQDQISSSYSPYVYNDVSSTFINYGFLNIIGAATTDKITELEKKLYQIASGLVTQEISQSEFDRAINPIIQNLNNGKKTNNYWLDLVMTGSSEKPYKLDWSKNREKDFASITKSEIQQLASTYLQDKRLIRSLVRPTP